MAARRIATPRWLTPRRLLAAAVLLVVAGLYVDPVQKYLRVTEQLRAQHAEVRSLERRQDDLARRAAWLEGNGGIIAAARACGWIMPGERPIVVTGVPQRDLTPCG